MEGNRYYFTLGTNEGFPFHGGWVEVVAHDLDEAIERYAKFFPPRELNGFVNCAFMYPEEQFKDTSMAKRGENMGHGCWAVIDAEGGIDYK